MQDELKRLTELDPAHNTFKDELCTIRYAKVMEIQRKIRGLLATQTAEKAYEGQKEFASFVWEDIFPETEMINVEFYKFLSDPEVRENLNLMASVEYTPPTKFENALNHLLGLYAYFALILIDSEPFSLAEVVLDYFFAKLMFEVGMLYELSIDKGRRDLKRTKKTSKTKKAKAQKKREYIVHIFPPCQKEGCWG